MPYLQRSQEVSLAMAYGDSGSIYADTLRPDMWSRQYLQQQNQVAAKNMNPYVFEYRLKITPS